MDYSDTSSVQRDGLDAEGNGVSGSVAAEIGMGVSSAGNTSVNGDNSQSDKEFRMSESDRSALLRKYGSAAPTSSSSPPSTNSSSAGFNTTVRSSRASTGGGGQSKSLAEMMQAQQMTIPGKPKSNSNFNPSFETSDYIPPVSRANNFSQHQNTNPDLTVQQLPQSTNSNSGKTLQSFVSESELANESVICNTLDVSSIFGPTFATASGRTSPSKSSNFESIGGLHHNNNNNIVRANGISSTTHGRTSPSLVQNNSNGNSSQRLAQLELENSQLKINITELLRDKDIEISAIHEDHNRQNDALKIELKHISEKLMRMERMSSSSDDGKSHEIEILSNQLTAASMDRDMFDKKADRLRVELDEKKNELNRVKMEYSRLRIESDGNNDMFKDQFKGLEMRYNKAISDMQEKLFSRDNDIMKQEEQLKMLRGEILEKTQKINHMIEDCANLERHWHQADADNNLLRRKVASLEQVEADLSQTKRRNQLLEGQLEGQSAELARQNSRCQQLQLQLQQYQLNQSNNANSSSGSSTLSNTGYTPSNFYPTRGAYSSYGSSSSNAAVNPSPNPSFSSNLSVSSSYSSQDYLPPPPTSSQVQSSSSSSAPLSSNQVKLDDWKSLGYPSEFAYAKDVGLLDIKPKVSSDPNISNNNNSNNSMNNINNTSNNHASVSNFNDSFTSNPRPKTTGRKSLGASIGGSAGMEGILSQLGSGSTNAVNGNNINNFSNNNISNNNSNSNVLGAPTRPSIDRTPFATEISSKEISNEYEQLDKKLTALINERDTLSDESDRLFQKGAKTIKERTRLSFIDNRVDELKLEITATKKLLSNKPV